MAVLRDSERGRLRRSRVTHCRVRVGARWRRSREGMYTGYGELLFTVEPIVDGVGTVRHQYWSTLGVLRCPRRLGLPQGLG